MNAWVTALDHVPLFLEGLGRTLLLLAISLTVATILAVPLAVAVSKRVPILAWTIEGCCYVLRGTPLIVQVYLLYYGLAQFAVVRDSILWPYLREAWVCLLITFSLGTCAYLIEIFRGAIDSVPRGEVEAARAVGLTDVKILTLVVLPNAFRRALPSYENEVIFSLHGTAIASLVTVVDLLGAGRNFNTTYYFTYEGFAIAGLVYLAVVGIIRLAFGALERRLLGHIRYRVS